MISSPKGFNISKATQNPSQPYKCSGKNFTLIICLELTHAIKRILCSGVISDARIPLIPGRFAQSDDILQYHVKKNCIAEMR